VSFLTTITRVFTIYSSPVSITTAGVTRTIMGLIIPMDSGTENTFFDGNESVGLLKPAYVLYVAGSEPSPPLANDVFTYLDSGGVGRLLTCEKVQAYRIANVVILYAALCD
jgi:hypothetical protein